MVEGEQRVSPDRLCLSHDPAIPLITVRLAERRGTILDRLDCLTPDLCLWQMNQHDLNERLWELLRIYANSLDHETRRTLHHMLKLAAFAGYAKAVDDDRKAKEKMAAWAQREEEKDVWPIGDNGKTSIDGKFEECATCDDKDNPLCGPGVGCSGQKGSDHD